MFAVVDIETTGGYTNQSGITEIAVVITDGVHIHDTYETLIDPGIGIPPYITALTGINDNMVEGAPAFHQIADKLFELLHDKIFVAHNVNFDYGFIKSAFTDCHIEFKARRLCTVRLSRKLLPGLHSYKLSNILLHCKINNSNPHRAMGDSKATALLFHKLIKLDNNDIISSFLKGNSHETILPVNLSKETFTSLPHEPGVYYFHDKKGKIIYIGKTKDIKKRIASHFTGNIKSRKKQDLYRLTYDLTIQKTGTGLIASLLEDREIKYYWPELNRAQKARDTRIGVYTYTDNLNRTRLAINKIQNHFPYVVSFSNQWEARTWLMDKAEKYQLNPTLCNIPGTVTGKDDIVHENQVEKMLNELVEESLSYIITGLGRHKEELSYVWVEKGRYRGFGFFPDGFAIENENQLETFLIEQKETAVTRKILASYMEKHQKDKNIRFFS